MFAIAGRAGVRPRRFWTDLEESIPEEKSGTTTCGHGLDVHLRRLNANSGGFGFVRQFVVSAVARHISGGAAHIETDNRQLAVEVLN